MGANWRLESRFVVKASVYMFVVLLLPTALIGVEHPGVVPKDVECTSCHASKICGKSVHSVMATSCDVCHVTQTQGDMTLVSLSMPKQKICFACHQESAALREHVPSVKGQCVDCHDAHSSDQKMLLRVVALSSQTKQR
jgi:predicted CXXCH cytochrome family protein